MSSKYREFEDGEWVYPSRNGFRFMCYSCGLVHKIDFKYNFRRILFRATRDERATGQARRRIRREKNGG